jgi:hypothetical protein
MDARGSYSDPEIDRILHDRRHARHANGAWNTASQRRKSDNELEASEQLSSDTTACTSVNVRQTSEEEVAI